MTRLGILTQLHMTGSIDGPHLYNIVFRSSRSRLCSMKVFSRLTTFMSIRIIPSSCWFTPRGSFHATNSPSRPCSSRTIFPRSPANSDGSHRIFNSELSSVKSMYLGVPSILLLSSVLSISCTTQPRNQESCVDVQPRKVAAGKETMFNGMQPCRRAKYLLCWSLRRSAHFERCAFQSAL